MDYGCIRDKYAYFLFTLLLPRPQRAYYFYFLIGRKDGYHGGKEGEAVPPFIYLPAS